ncbi:hypothetical protein LP417_11585 [Polaromonas sp. P1-6]|nr:hypothetical protein LP417_11585 [Polaromonas sp. P1-6]
MVDAIVIEPWAAHPTDSYGYYLRDLDHCDLYGEMSKTPVGFQRYVDEWIVGTQTHAGFVLQAGRGAHRAVVQAQGGMGMTTCTAFEQLLFTGATQIPDDGVVFVGFHWPMLMSRIARRLHAPNVTVVYENGIVEDRITPLLPTSPCDLTAAEGSPVCAGSNCRARAAAT